MIFFPAADSGAFYDAETAQEYDQVHGGYRGPKAGPDTRRRHCVRRYVPRM
jgi:hypothetical protein